MSAPEFFNPGAMTAPLGAYTHCAWVRAGSDILYIAGQVGVRPDGALPATVREQADEAYANIARILTDAKLTPANLVKLNTYLVVGQRVEDFAGARQRALGDIRPAATFVFVPQLIDAKYLIEVEAVAAR
jgi:enamine deaminase RidA (YjgF/YER057c/UK114 family)